MPTENEIQEALKRLELPEEKRAIWEDILAHAKHKRTGSD